MEEKLQALDEHPVTKSAMVGFDGFVDSIRKAVKSREGQSVFHFKTLVEFSERIRAASGKSGQVEMDVQRIKLGGNAPILSAALSTFKIPTTCIGSIDHPVCESLASQCKTVAVLSPGESDAIEFDDGKIILSDLSVFQKYDWDHVKSAVGLERLKSIIRDTQLLALVDWANVVHAEAIWDGLLHDVIKPSGRKDYLFFFDLCDPSRKSANQIDDILDLIGDFSYYGSVTLGLNTNEAFAIWSALTGKKIIDSVEEAGKFIHYTMNIDNLLIHPIDRTLLFTKTEIIELPGRLVTNPRIQTGGGDNLNAGFILGQLAGFPIHECIVLGMAASGSYVQEGKSADLTGLLQYIRTWMYELKSRPEQDSEMKPVLFSLPILH
ncbi:MAG TPA: hypothetical protein VFE50_26820 [Cyclobacteriaceae bacterium]|nr:hypothetical protein [Cyclobacteriaceae bacterium]